MGRNGETREEIGSGTRRNIGVRQAKRTTRAEECGEGAGKLQILKIYNKASPTDATSKCAGRRRRQDSGEKNEKGLPLKENVRVGCTG